MKKMMLSLCVLVLMASGAMGQTTWMVDPLGAGDYTTIGDAITAAADGDIISIGIGTYLERPVVNKELSFVGADEATVIIDAGIGAVGGSYGFTVSANNVSVSNLTLIGDTGLAVPGYGFKASSVTDFNLTNVTAKNFYRTGVDLLGVTTGVLLDVVSINNVGHGLSVLDCHDVTITNLTASGNGWQGVSVATWGRYSPLGTSGIVFDGINSFVDAFQIEMGDYNNPGVAPAGAAIVTYSTNPLDYAGLTVLASDFGFAVHGDQDDGPDQVRIWFAPDLVTAALLPAFGPVGHFTGTGYYIESLTDGTTKYVTPGCSIQAAIDAADPDDTVDVATGVYREQLNIAKNLNLTGSGMTPPTIEAPDPNDRTTYISTSWTGSTKTIDAVIGVQSATVNISNLKVDGRNTGPDNFYGIHGDDCNGSVTFCEVTNITYPAGPGAQNVLGVVFTHSMALGPFTIDISDNVIPNMQKGGIAIKGPSSVFTVNDNQVTANSSPDIAGNGIQLSYGATGSTSGNTVTGAGYTGTGWVGTGILLFESGDVTMNGDTVTGNQSGINFSDWHWGWIAPGPVNLTFDNLVMTDNEWSFGVQLSGDGSDVNVTMNNCVITGSTGDAIDVWGSGSSSYYTGWANGNLDVTIDGLTLDDTAIDGIWTADLSGAGTNSVNSFDVTNSSFTNTIGGAIANTFTSTINAPGNYWGDVGGPLGGAKAAIVKTMPMTAPWGNKLSATPASVTVGGDKVAETITGPVDFSPWYGFPLGTVPMTIGTNDNIQDAIDLALSGDTVSAVATTFVAPSQIIVDRNLTITGAGPATIIEPGFNTGTGYVSTSGLIYVDYGVTATIENLAIDGTGFVVNHAIQSRGTSLTVRDCEIRDIYSSIYDGRGVVFLKGTGLVENCTLTNIQRIGIHIRGGVESPNPVVVVDGLDYTGKGVGDFLDYGVEFGGGGQGSVTGSQITNCLGVADVDGSDSAGILVTDFYGTFTTADITNTTLTGNSTGMVVGYDVADISAVTIHGSTIADNTTAGVTTTGVVVDALNNWWGTASGPEHPLLNPLGSGNSVSDNILFDPWSGMGAIATTPATTGPVTCGVETMLTFSLETDEYTPDVFGFNAVVRAGSEVSWGAVESSAPFGASTQFLYFDQGDGSYIISGTTTGSPLEPISGAGITDLFTIKFTATGDGDADITFDSLTLRDPSNAPIPVTGTGATITVDCTAPAAVTGITAAPGNNKVDVSWTHNGADTATYEIYRGLWYDGTLNVSAYPEYDDLTGDITPTRPTGYGAYPIPGEWVLAGTVNVGTTSFTDLWPELATRGVYYYEVFAVDTATNPSAIAAANDRATSYWLGDVAGDIPSLIPDGVVDAGDINQLGAAFGTVDNGVDPFASTIDVGPTDDWSRVGIPTTDSAINFEDLMVFSMNFGVVTMSKTKAPVSTVVNLAWVAYEDGSMALRLVSGSGLKGLRVRADLPVADITAGQLLDDQSELTFLKNVGQKLDVSVAVMGVNQGFDGTGDLFVLRAESPIMVEDLQIMARGFDNSELEVQLDKASDTLTPCVFSLNANYPNPFNPMTKIAFSLPEAQEVKLAVYGVDGRRIATLINETRAAGLHEIVWTGQNDDGQSVASGLYFYRIDAGPYSQVRKMTLMK